MAQIYPKPNVEKLGKEIGYMGSITFYYFDSRQPLPNILSAIHSAGGEIDVEVYIGPEPPASGFHMEKRHMVRDEGYLIEIRRVEEKKVTAWICSYSPRGYYYSFCTLAQLVRQPLREGFILDQPLMKMRGIVEGYYGRPWTAEERTRALTIMAEQKMNTYIYAPKNDPYHREEWATPYPDKEEKDIKELILRCKEFFIDFVFAVSPGFSIKYSSCQHSQLLMSKYKHMFVSGVRLFGLFFDDIPHELWHEDDKNQFHDLAEAQIHFILGIYAMLKELDPANQLIICPTHYYGKGDEAYISRLGEALPREIHLLWTGRTICSPEIDLREARIFYENTRHQPLYWDNYPVNDANMRDEMHIGPIKNRDPKLFLHSTGLIANVMEFAEASLIPLITIAHYLWNPLQYDAEASFRYAVESIVGPQDMESFLIVSDCINQSSIAPLPGQELLMKWFEHQQYKKSDRNAKDGFDRVVKQYLGHVDRLIRDMGNEKLKKELFPWLLEVKNDLEYLLDVLQYTDYPEKMEEISNRKYGKRAKTLGFFPHLIASEMIWEKRK